MTDSGCCDGTAGAPVRRLAVLGDSTAVGIGDRRAGGGWRGVGPLIADALRVDGDGYLNTAFTGARMECVRTRQLPAALAHAPDVAVLLVGMNDTLRSDFDAAGLAASLDAMVAALADAGALPLTVRYHDHGRVFRLPGPLRRALADRIDALNRGVDAVVARRGTPCLDLAAVPGAYEMPAWSVDRLHPSELGHRMLAAGMAELIADAGFRVPRPVELACGGGSAPRRVEHLGWLLAKGVPWLWRRGRDLIPHAAGIMARSTARAAVRSATGGWAGAGGAPGPRLAEGAHRCWPPADAAAEGVEAG